MEILHKLHLGRRGMGYPSSVRVRLEWPILSRARSLSSVFIVVMNSRFQHPVRFSLNFHFQGLVSATNSGFFLIWIRNYSRLHYSVDIFGCSVYLSLTLNIRLETQQIFMNAFCLSFLKTFFPTFREIGEVNIIDLRGIVALCDPEKEGKSATTTYVIVKDIVYCFH